MFFTGMCHSFCPHGGCIPACNGAGGVQSSMQWVGVKVSACGGVSQGGGGSAQGNGYYTPETATEVGGMHPTGMHSCFEVN